MPMIESRTPVLPNSRRGRTLDAIPPVWQCAGSIASAAVVRAAALRKPRRLHPLEAGESMRGIKQTTRAKSNRLQNGTIRGSRPNRIPIAENRAGENIPPAAGSANLALLWCSPPIRRALVRVLYHERVRRKIPMTRLVDSILTDALKSTESWRMMEEPPEYQPSVQGES